MHECADLGRTVGYRFLEMENMGDSLNPGLGYLFPLVGHAWDVTSARYWQTGGEEDMMLLPKRWKNVVSTNFSLPV
jgi:hypothetical protein